MSQKNAIELTNGACLRLCWTLKGEREEADFGRISKFNSEKFTFKFNVTPGHYLFAFALPQTLNHLTDSAFRKLGLNKKLQFIGSEDSRYTIYCRAKLEQQKYILFHDSLKVDPTKCEHTSVWFHVWNSAHTALECTTLQLSFRSNTMLRKLSVRSALYKLEHHENPAKALEWNSHSEELHEAKRDAEKKVRTLILSTCFRSSDSTDALHQDFDESEDGSESRSADDWQRIPGNTSYTTSDQDVSSWVFLEDGSRFSDTLSFGNEEELLPNTSVKESEVRAGLEKMQAASDLTKVPLVRSASAMPSYRAQPSVRPSLLSSSSNRMVPKRSEGINTQGKSKKLLQKLRENHSGYNHSDWSREASRSAAPMAKPQVLQRAHTVGGSGVTIPQTLSFRSGRGLGKKPSSPAQLRATQRAAVRRLVASGMKVCEDSAILSKFQLALLIAQFPPRLRVKGWRKMFDLTSKGANIDYLVKLAQEHRGQQFLIIKDAMGSVFGVLIEEGFASTSGQFLGSNYVMVFSRDTVTGEFCTFGKNAMDRPVRRVGEEGIWIGPGTNFALYLDGDLRLGTSGCSEELNNQPLASSATFYCTDLEVWT